MTNEKDPRSKVSQGLSLEGSSSLSRRQQMAIHASNKFADELIRYGKDAEIIEIFKTPVDPDGPVVTRASIAEAVIPNDLEKRRRIAINAIGIVIERSLPREEIDIFRDARRSITSSRTIKNQTSEQRAKASSAGGKASGKLLREGKRKMPVFGIPWSREEITRLKAFARSKRFRHKSGAAKGRPNWEAITNALNGESGHRTTKSVVHAFAAHRR